MTFLRDLLAKRIDDVRPPRPLRGRYEGLAVGVYSGSRIWPLRGGCPRRSTAARGRRLQPRRLHPLQNGGLHEREQVRGACQTPESPIFRTRLRHLTRPCPGPRRRPLPPRPRTRQGPRPPHARHRSRRLFARASRGWRRHCSRRATWGSISTPRTVGRTATLRLRELRPPGCESSRRGIISLASRSDGLHRVRVLFPPQRRPRLPLPDGARFEC